MKTITRTKTVTVKRRRFKRTVNEEKQVTNSMSYKILFASPDALEDEAYTNGLRGGVFGCANEQTMAVAE